MRSDTPGLRPPFIASRLIGLFTSGWHDDAISGDLLEEFSDVASKSGLAYARRWYWRQSIKTIWNLIVAGSRTAPWLIPSTVIGGYWLLERPIQREILKSDNRLKAINANRFVDFRASFK